MKTYELQKKNRFRLLLKICSLLFCFGMMFCINASAASNKTVQKAYGKFLKKYNAISISDRDFYDASYSPRNKSFIGSFALCDIDKDKTPELITQTNLNFKYAIIRIYKYKNGKVQLYKFKDKTNVEWIDSSTANGRYTWYVCNKGHIHNSWWAFDGQMDTIYKINTQKKRLNYYLKYERQGEYPGLNFYWSSSNGYNSFKEISKSSYEKKVKNCKALNLIYYTNDSSSRKKLSKGTCKISK